MRWRKFKSILLVGSLILSLTAEMFMSGTYFATKEESDYSKGEENEDGSYKYETGEDKEKLQEELNKIVQSIPEKKGTVIPLDSVLTCYLGLKEGGLNDYQAVGLTCNFIRETSLIPDVQPFVTTNAGIAGWGKPRINNLEKFSEEVGDTRYTVNGFTFGGLATQVAFAAAEATTGEKTGAAANVDYVMTLKRAPFSRWLTNLDRDKVKEMTWDKDVDFSDPLTKEIWNSLECPLACYLYAYVNFEVGEQELDVMSRGGNQAQPLYELLTGIDAEQAGGLMEEESANEFANIMKLRDNDIYEVETWKSDLEKTNSESILIRGGRFLTILFGILFEVWMLLIYLSYWFDRLNNFFAFSVMRIVTFGKLSISPDESECTFSLTDLSSSSMKTVNHKKVLEICIIGLAFGTLVVSGAMFDILSLLINRVLNILG